MAGQAGGIGDLPRAPVLGQLGLAPIDGYRIDARRMAGFEQGMDAISFVQVQAA